MVYGIRHFGAVLDRRNLDGDEIAKKQGVCKRDQLDGWKLSEKQRAFIESMLGDREHKKQ
ncbi:hypothetical protein [Erwinia sp. V71]|uniref:hypothetical protein n=1 Tax=Erwinia sp. V71 TaxID=3369424 RepID=UPI003F62EE8B